MTVRELTGTVTDKFGDQFAEFLVVQSQEDESAVCVRCWSKVVKGQIEYLKAGDRVRVLGSIKSRQGTKPDKNGVLRWFTEFEAREVAIVTATGKTKVIESDEETEELWKRGSI